MAWNNVAKPTSPTWTNENPSGKQQYDQSSISYDDANVFWDGVNPSMWNNVAKPTNGDTFTILAGMVTGLIMPVTYSREININTFGDWVKVSKPT